VALKILIFSDYPPPNGAITGGIPRSVHSTVTALCEVDTTLEIHICTLTSEVKEDVTKRTENLFIHYIRFPLANYPILVPCLLTQGIVKREITKINPDIVHIQGIGKYYAHPVIKLRFDPTIITVHGIIHEESKTWSGILGKYRAIRGKRSEDYVLKNAKYLVAVSPYVKDIIKPTTKGNISVIYNPVNEKFFNVKKEEVANRILFVGGIEQRKGLHILVEAIRIVKHVIPEVRLHIVGGIRKKDYYKKVYEKTKEYNLSENIIFKGVLTDKELIKEYSEAAISILPSEEESQGIVLLEAMATETPIIASNIGGIPYIVTDGSTGYLVDFGDYKKMAEYIIKLLSSKKLRRTMGLAGREAARQYQPKEIAMAHLQMYQRIFNNEN